MCIASPSNIKYSGKYNNADEIIAEALQLLDQHDQEYQTWVEETREKVDVAIEELRRGEGIEGAIERKITSSASGASMNRYIIASSASRDLNEIIDYFAKLNVETGERLIAVFEKKCYHLSKNHQKTRHFKALQIQ